MVNNNENLREYFYHFLSAIFIASLVTCNLIANKFVTVDLGFKVFIVSAGILPYPITFLVTDLISELYGQKKDEVIYSVSRSKLNMTLMDHAENSGGINIYFNQELQDLDLDKPWQSGQSPHYRSLWVSLHQMTNSQLKKSLKY